MANIETIEADWADVPQLEESTFALGGKDGPMNSQAVAIVKRLNSLRNEAVSLRDNLTALGVDVDGAIDRIDSIEETISQNDSGAVIAAERLGIKGYAPGGAPVDENDRINMAMERVAADGGGVIVFDPRKNYGFDSLAMQSRVELSGGASRALQVLPVATPARGQGAVLVKLGSHGDAVIFGGSAYSAAMDGFIMDLTRQEDGCGVVHESGSVAQRTGQTASHLLIYGAAEDAYVITANNKEVRLNDVFLRGGATDADRRTQRGLVSASQDCVFNDLLVGFIAGDGITETGSAQRYRDVDVWNAGLDAVRLLGSSSRWMNLQCNNNGRSGVYASGADYTHKVLGYRSIQNSLAGDAPDVLATGHGRLIIEAAEIMGTGAVGLTSAAIDVGDLRARLMVSGLVRGSGYAAHVSNMARAYAELSRLLQWNGLERNPARGMQVNPFPNMFPVVSDGGNGWTSLNSATISFVAVSSALQARQNVARITSGAAATSGYTLDLTASHLNQARGNRVRFTAQVRGSGSTYLGNQFIQMIWGAGGSDSARENIRNDGEFWTVAIDRAIPSDATQLRFRLVAANALAAGLSIDVGRTEITIY